MEKLIEYLTEFSSEDFNWEYRDGKIYDRQNMYPDGDLLEEMTVYVISKKFGFIQWLMNHDKIETKRLDTIEIIPRFGTIGKKVIGEKRILMFLSIQDNPIKFLISILK